MTVEGLKLAALGMGVVFIFLILLVLLIKLASWLLAPMTLRELKEKKRQEKLDAERRARQRQRKTQLMAVPVAESEPADKAQYHMEKNRLIAVISAAINRYRKDHA